MRAKRSTGRGGVLGWFVPLGVAVVLLAVAIGTAVAGHSRERESLDRALANEARKQSEALDHYFARARSLTQVTANNPAFRQFYAEPGDRRAKVLAQGRTVREANRALAYLEHLFPGSIGEACFIDRSGPENARAVRGAVAPLSDLSPDEGKAPFFGPTFALKPGQVYQAKPYISPDTHDWVISNSTPLPAASGTAPAIVHFEISLDSFRRETGGARGRFEIAVVEANSGRVIVDSRHPQPAGDDALLGRPFDDRFERVISTLGRASDEGTVEVDGTPSAFEAVEPSAHNANHWVVVALAKHPPSTWLGQLGLVELLMAGIGLLLLGYAALTLRSSHARLHSAASTDPLTGLGNRRKLLQELETALATADEAQPLLVAMFDLDGFKSYNDSFGHPAGDALLVRLGANLRDSLAGLGTPYRLGGDEFCVIARLDGEHADSVLTAAERGLTERGEGFTITCSYGSVVVPLETDDAKEALRLADQRMYANKQAGRGSASRQTTDVVVKLLAERHPDLAEHIDEVTELTAEVARRLELPEGELPSLLQAAALHDVGKVAVPDAILAKPGSLSDEEWTFIHQHTVIGERILAVAPALAAAAQLVRASHEHFDGTGYPDGLAGEEIPLGARIICVCDAFDAMTSPRPYRPTPLSVEGALAELRAGAGGQFDPLVVEAFSNSLSRRRGARAGMAAGHPPAD